jgi:hypothetical protein
MAVDSNDKRLGRGCDDSSSISQLDPIYKNRALLVGVKYNQSSDLFRV